MAYGRRVFELAPGPKWFVLAPGAGQNDLIVAGGKPYLAVWR